MDQSAFTWTVRIRVKQGETILFGSGVAKLLLKTKQHGSLHAAAKEMQMSYRKALEIIQRTENHLAQPLLRKAIGGTGGGGSELTASAHLLLQRFESLQQKIDHYTEQLSQGFFDGFDSPLDAKAQK